jgi:general secretion pathway protein M
MSPDTTKSPLDRLFARYPALAVLGYVAIVAMLGVTTVVALADLYDRNTALAAATDMLDQIEGRKVAPGGAAIFAGAPDGSPFLEGQTVTVAGAALQQRITAAVGKLGGSVLSSQVDLAGTLSKEGFVSLVASCELEQPAIQQLLYDLEAGMPFLFVDQLVVQAPEAGTSQEGTGGRMRVLLAVSGQWKGAK